MGEASILLVDDENIIRKCLTKELKAEHFSVTEVANGVDAIRAIQDFQFNLVITDLMMEGIDGFGVLKAVKELAPLTRVMVITGYGDIRTAIEALHLGADDFLVKPFEMEEFLFRIRRCLEKRSLIEMLMEKTNQLEKEITRRRLIEEQLLESDNRFRLALDASSNGVWDRNLVTGETYHGDNWYRTLGYTNKEIIKSFEELLHPDDREKVFALGEDHLQGKCPRFEAEFRLRNQAGDWQWVLSRGKVVTRDNQGKALRIIGTITDISQLKKEEAELIQSQEQLMKQLQERTEKLREYDTAIPVALNKCDEDRKNSFDRVLANIPGWVESLLDQMEDYQSPEQRLVFANELRARICTLISPAGNMSQDNGD
ncbi:MAG: hypothetical protein VR65_00775 [Desulfobulbaceae bacterium BRH_c16a]|nr:MAG: hypothetical protein VR65_00775 [Desulfobulbaceae bacterium BRH_c16a]